MVSKHQKLVVKLPLRQMKMQKIKRHIRRVSNRTSIDFFANTKSKVSYGPAIKQKPIGHKKQYRVAL